MSEACRTARPVHIRDWDEVPPDRFPETAMRTWGRRSTLSLPLLRNREVVGVFNISKVEPGGYADDELSVLQAFADQAAIAVDNARLLREIEERNSELTESLELQTATSEALRLISTHPGDLTTVLDAIVTKAAGLCDAPFGSVLLKDGPVLRISAAKIDSDLDMAIGMEFPADDGNVNTHAATSNTALAFDDLHVIAPELAETFPNSRSYATVALFSKAEWIGNINIVRPEVRPFDDADLAVLQAFADQASLAVSNARLFNDLDAALERQTAMTDVLDAVSTARDDLQPVFDAVTRQAHRLCGGATAALFLHDGDVLRAVGFEGQETEKVWAFPIDSSSNPASDALSTAQMVHIRDWNDIASDRYPDSALRKSGLLSTIQIPMLRHGTSIGVLGFTRAESGGFTDPEVEVLQAFAAAGGDRCRQRPPAPGDRGAQQRTVRLTRAADRHQRGPAADQRQPGRPHARARGSRRSGGGIVRCRLGTAVAPERRRPPLRGPGHRQAGHEGRADVRRRRLPGNVTQCLPEQCRTSSTRVRRRHRSRVYGDPMREKTLAGGFRSVTTIALFSDDEWIGNLNLGRQDVRPFDRSTGTILQAFADHAAIAVANAKLFNDLDAALERQTAMTDVLDAVSTSRLDLSPVFDAVVHHANRLCSGTGADHLRARRRTNSGQSLRAAVHAPRTKPSGCSRCDFRSMPTRPPATPR